jgi:hypothetical protein
MISNLLDALGNTIAQVNGVLAEDNLKHHSFPPD